LTEAFGGFFGFYAVEFLFPKTQSGFIQVKHPGHFADGIKDFGIGQNGVFRIGCAGVF